AGPRASRGSSPALVLQLRANDGRRSSVGDLLAKPPSCHMGNVSTVVPRNHELGRAPLTRGVGLVHSSRISVQSTFGGAESITPTLAIGILRFGYQPLCGPLVPGTPGLAPPNQSPKWPAWCGPWPSCLGSPDRSALRPVPRPTATECRPPAPRRSEFGFLPAIR